MGYNKRIVLTPKQEAYLIKHFKHTHNADLAEKLGISETSLHRFARKLGLTKTRQFMRKCQADTAHAAKVSHLRHGTYPPKGYIIPRSEEFRFKPGEKPVDRLGEKKNAERIRKSKESRAKTWRYEHARFIFGVPRKTKLRVVQQPRQKILDRSYLKKRGYILDEDARVAYWTENTMRSTRLEARPVRFYKFAKYQD